MSNETEMASLDAALERDALAASAAAYRDNAANLNSAAAGGLVGGAIGFRDPRMSQDEFEQQWRALKEAEHAASGYLDKLVIYRSADKQWRWKRVAPNGEIVGASSEGYRGYSDCRKNMQRQHTPCEVADVVVED